MTYLFTKRGPQYHWILDILEQMCLPVVQNLPSILEKLNADRFFDIESKKTNVAKARRKLYKRKRKVFEHQRRQLFVKESAMNHDYGRDASTEEAIADALTDKCKCGSTDHRRTSHKSCRLRTTCDTATGIDTSCDINASKSDDNVSENDDDCYDFECSLMTKSFHSLESDCLIDEEKTKGVSKVCMKCYHLLLPIEIGYRKQLQLYQSFLVSQLFNVFMLSNRFLAEKWLLIFGMRLSVMGHVSIGQFQKPLL
uniref:Uncharacterized protein n=1 Tax=Amphimedon queenslandica TaxID=400682 RepID=A0A1X7UDA9_AMPQE